MTLDNVRAYMFGVLTGLLLCMILPRSAHAEPGDVWAVATIASKHFGGDSNRDYNERNFGLGGEVELTERWRAAAGFMKNSNDIDSTYLLGAYCAAQWYSGPWRTCLNVAGGAVSGYDVDLLWVVFPVISVEWNRSLGLNLSYFRTQESKANVIGLQIKTTGRWEPLK